MQALGCHEISSPRFYFVPLTRECLAECQLCASLGCRNSTDRDLSSVSRLIQRARMGGFSAMLFSPSFLLFPCAEQALRACGEAGLQSILQIPWRALLAHKDEVLRWCA